MAEQTRVLVVGTTGDYVHWLRTQWPGRCLFLTDPADREGAMEPAPLPAEELVYDLGNVPLVRAELDEHLDRHDLVLDGVACFDCNSMELAAILGEKFALPFSSPAAIKLCRDKYRSKLVWHESGLRCPSVCLVQQAADAVSFMSDNGSPCVLKPRTGTGSELVFRCTTSAECERGVRLIEACLGGREKDDLSAAARAGVVVESWVAGEEYSCDCLVLADRVEILRVTRKIRAVNAPFGTTQGYQLCSGVPVQAWGEQLAVTLLSAARTLGVVSAVCMADFIICDQAIVLLELTPRPGGDCLPQLLRRAWGFDILGFTLDIAQRRPWTLPEAGVTDQCVALRLHAAIPGVLENVDTGAVACDPRVLEIAIIRQPGHRIVLPPDDYSSWYLGYVLFQPARGMDVDRQCRELHDLVPIDVF